MGNTGARERGREGGGGEGEGEEGWEAGRERGGGEKKGQQSELLSQKRSLELLFSQMSELQPRSSFSRRHQSISLV